MSTRQLRLTGPVQIQKKINDFLGKQINIVLNDRTVLLGQLQGVNDSKIEIINMRLKKVSVPLQQITEIYFDTKE